MTNILSGDPTCNTHNALQNMTIGTYACGVTFKYTSSSTLQNVTWYAVPAVQQCCDIVNAPVYRIPGNTACEMQYCEVPGSEQELGTGPVIGPNQNLTDCLLFVYEKDVPPGIGSQLRWVSSWGTVRMYDTDLPLSEVRNSVLADAAPPGWTSTALQSAPSPTHNVASGPGTNAGSALPRCNGLWGKVVVFLGFTIAILR